MNDDQRRITLVIPADVRARLEAEQRALSQQIGARLSLNQCATVLLRRALECHADIPVSAGN